ncbi:MAG: hypothetical protein JWM78_978 [Verrucomicrobiaceae bacterium]|nr:hypothetical protein [Verrucomicrobiaceae bacterium]
MIHSEVARAEKPLTVQSELAEAEAFTGLKDWGSDLAFLEGLSILIDAIEDMKPTVEFRTTTKGRIQHVLRTRLHLREDERNHPEITAADIKKVLVVTGLPRSGTTVTFDLLAQDPANRWPREWETYAPWPAPELATIDTDPRIDVLNNLFKHLLEVAPEFATVQRLDCRQPGECNHIMMMNFDGTDWWAEMGVPKHLAWSSSQPSEGMYRSHKRVLQQLQWKGGTGRWLIKAPQHMFDLPGLIKSYPEADIVWTHRDPISTVSSLSSMVSMLQKAFGAPVDLKRIGAEISDVWITGVLRGMESREANPDIERRIIDIPHRDVIKQPAAVVRRIYDKFGLPFTDDLQRRIDTFINESDNAQRLGKHSHHPAEFGIDPDQVRERLAPYYKRFGDLLTY